MKNRLLLIVLLFITLNGFGQDKAVHFIKFLHVGEKIQPVYTLNISYQNGEIPKDSAEIVSDTSHVVSILTDVTTFNTIANYIKEANFHLSPNPGKLYFGTFKIMVDGSRYYLPDLSCTAYFKKLVKVLKKAGNDPEAIKQIVDNYPWIFNP